MRFFPRLHAISIILSLTVMASVTDLFLCRLNSVIAREPAADEVAETAPISVSGRAVTQDRKPVAGVKITLASTNGINKRLAETTTDADGRYVFRDVPLPVSGEKGDPVRGGAFEVFGEAEGLAIAWHGMRFFNTKRRPQQGFVAMAGCRAFFPGERIEMNLTLRREKELVGRAIDDQGNPVAGVQIELSSLDYLNTEGLEPHPNFREFWVAMRLLPAHYREATTGTDGRFTIQGLPEESVVVVQVKHPDHASQMFRAAITKTKVTEWNQEPVLTSPLVIRQRSTRRVRVQVRYDDDKRPARNLEICADSAGAGPDTGDFGQSDEDGRVDLKLPPGTYALWVDPPVDSNYVRSYAKLIVQDKPSAQAAELNIQLGAILILEAIDTTSGMGIPGASFVHSVEGSEALEHLGSSTFIAGESETNGKGEFRAVVYPGEREYQILPPLGYKLVGSKKHEIDCKAGETTRIRFELKKSTTR